MIRLAHSFIHENFLGMIKGWLDRTADIKMSFFPSTVCVLCFSRKYPSTPPLSMEGVFVCTPPPHLSRNSNFAPYFSFKNVCFCPPPPPPRNFHSVVGEEAQSLEVSWGWPKVWAEREAEGKMSYFFCPLYVYFRLLILRCHVLVFLQSGWMTPYLYLKPFLVSKWPLILLEVVIR